MSEHSLRKVTGRRRIRHPRLDPCLSRPLTSTPRCSTPPSKGFAFPAVNVSSSSTINAVLQGLTEAGSDGIIQVTTGGADYFAGQTVKARASGALAFAAFATEVAKNYPITVALHTDHCPKDALDGFVLPADRGLRGRGQGRPQPDLPVAHVGRLGGAAGRERRDREASCSPA